MRIMERLFERYKIDKDRKSADKLSDEQIEYSSVHRKFKIH